MSIPNRQAERLDTDSVPQAMTAGMSRAAQRAAELRARRTGGQGTPSPRLPPTKRPMPPAFMARPHKAKV